MGVTAIRLVRARKADQSPAIPLRFSGKTKVRLSANGKPIGKPVQVKGGAAFETVWIPLVGKSGWNGRKEDKQ